MLDTSVVLSALLWNGQPYRLLQMALDEDIELVSSRELLDELRDVLAREMFAARLAPQSTALEQALECYAAAALQPMPDEAPHGVPAIIAAAIAARADLIVSQDGDLRERRADHGIPIASVAEAVRRLVPVGHPL